MKKIGISVLLTAFAVLILSSCTLLQAEKNSSVVKKAVDYKGNQYSVVLDKNGFLSLGEKSGLAVTVDDDGSPGKNANGEFVTKSAEFPDTLRVENEVHTKFFKISIPDTWKDKSGETVVLEYSQGEHTAQIMVNERSSDTLEECVEEIEKLCQSSEEVKKENMSLSFAEAVKIKYKDMFVFYVFSAEERTYFVRVTADKELFEKINFEDIINTIKFRKGE